MKLKPSIRYEADIFEQAAYPKDGTEPCLRIWAVNGEGKREAILFQPLSQMMPSRLDFCIKRHD